MRPPCSGGRKGQASGAPIFSGPGLTMTRPRPAIRHRSPKRWMVRLTGSVAACLALALLAGCGAGSDASAGNAGSAGGTTTGQTTTGSTANSQAAFADCMRAQGVEHPRPLGRQRKRPRPGADRHRPGCAAEGHPGVRAVSPGRRRTARRPRRLRLPWRWPGVRAVPAQGGHHRAGPPGTPSPSVREAEPRLAGPKGPSGRGQVPVREAVSLPRRLLRSSDHAAGYPHRRSRGLKHYAAG